MHGKTKIEKPGTTYGYLTVIEYYKTEKTGAYWKKVWEIIV